MQQLQPLWNSMMANPAQPPVPVFDLTPTFRVNQQRESGGNQIITWTLKVGDQIFQSGQPAHSGRWSLGEPVTLTLEWAKDAAVMPVPGTGTGDPVMSVRGRVATFR